MAADVSSLVRVLNRYKDDRTAGNESKSTTSSLITQDLLGGGAGSDHSIKNEFQELDLDFQVPSGWEKRLDLKSGKVYLQRCNSPNSPSSSDYRQHQSNGTVPKLQDLNFPPSPSSKRLLSLFDESSLELKLVSSPSQSSSTANNNVYQSVCTLDKVKSALERAKKEPHKKRSSSMWNSPALPLSPSYSSSFSSIRDSKDKEEDIMEDNKFLACSISSPVAAGCPGCLCYALITKNNPKYPRCNSIVPLPAMKKPRIDLNISM